MNALTLHSLPSILEIGIDAPDPADTPEAFSAWLLDQSEPRALESVRLTGRVRSHSILRALSLLRPALAEGARIEIDDAHFSSVYEGVAEAAVIHPEYRFELLELAETSDCGPGRAIAGLSFSSARRSAQSSSTIPENKHRRLVGDTFGSPEPIMPPGTAHTIVAQAAARWRANSAEEAGQCNDALAREFPDSVGTSDYWHAGAGIPFKDFFVWGHDHEFGFGQRRPGAMGGRHLEITAESVHLGLLPFDLAGQRVLNVGCWTGGDFQVLCGLGADVTAIEEHPVSARAAARLAELTGCGARVEHQSLYDDHPEWRGHFDVVYCAGVIYHVTDPVLFLRLCFAYLKPGGRLIVETKAESGQGSRCAYAGTHEKGWNWYAPTRDALGRWLADAGFPPEEICVHWRPIGRLLAGAVKLEPAALPDAAGFSRPGSWLEGSI